MSGSRTPLVLPDLGMPEVTILAGGWLVERGSQVAAGDRLLEIVAGCVTINLPSPASGIVAELLVEADDELTVGQVLALIDEDSSLP